MQFHVENKPNWCLFFVFWFFFFGLCYVFKEDSAFIRIFFPIGIDFINETIL